jgi:hypothetical protein
MNINLTLDFAQLFFTICGGISALFLFYKSNQEKKNQLLLNIFDKFYNDKEINKVLYSLDKEENLDGIKYGGKLEIEIDKTLRFLDLIGQFLKDGQIKKRDLIAFKYEINCILSNATVMNYIEWLEKNGILLNNLNTLKSEL